ncbi:MAG: hypothetical protein AB7T06_02170 [Kofleriaceae bacterium]
MSGIANRPTLRATLFEAACEAAMETEIGAMIEAALAPYDNDPEPPMLGFRDSMDDIPEDDDCPICRELNEQYGAPILTPLPDGSVLEIRRARSAEAMPAT